MSIESPELENNAHQINANEARCQHNYSLAASLYEQAIQQHPYDLSNYWYLGLMLLLQGHEIEAQTTWLMAMAEGDADQVNQWTADLIAILQIEAECQTQLNNLALAWGIRCHMREIAPEYLPNLLSIVGLLGQQGTLRGSEIVALEVIPVLQTCPIGKVDPDLLIQTFSAALSIPAHPVLVEFMAAALPHLPDLQAIDEQFMSAMMNIAFSQGAPQLAVQLLEQYLPVAPKPINVRAQLASAYQDAGEHQRGIEVARQVLTEASTPVTKLLASYLVLRGIMSTGGIWQDLIVASAHHNVLMTQLSQEMPQDVALNHALSLLNVGFFLPYIEDNLLKNRKQQNQLAQICQLNIRKMVAEPLHYYQQGIHARCRNASSSKRLKIGYLSSCLGRHSVGWLARWLIQHHDREQFQVYGYFLREFHNDRLHDWYLQNMDSACRIGIECECGTTALADQIYRDEIDILVDLDSNTAYKTCDLLTIKPAPIQVTWLGWDATGLDSIDYFLADPYVLPTWAQDHYVEKIWRLPHTYLAVDGFEIGVPTLRREDLNVPLDAVLFLSAQAPYKRHPHIVQLQLQIIKAVPNSYFLIKGRGNQEALQSFFIDLAAAVGLSTDRLRFLPNAPSEETHRANLDVVDVVLDTFPYNGATTTMETLWMGVPMVTRVGNQFASRNSYTMMKNAGIEEGIAWTDEEYIDWGVRLGRDEALRRQVAEKLKRSRQTAPLWNATAFTRDVEAAYQQMWKIYLQKRSA